MIHATIAGLEGMNRPTKVARLTSAGGRKCFPSLISSLRCPVSVFRTFLATVRTIPKQGLTRWNPFPGERVVRWGFSRRIHIRRILVHNQKFRRTTQPARQSIANTRKTLPTSTKGRNTHCGGEPAASALLRAIRSKPVARATFSNSAS